MQTLQDKSGSGIVTLPKADLERDGVLEDGEIPGEQNLVVDRLGRRVYLIRLVDNAEIPDPAETEVVKRLAAQRLLEQDVYGGVQSAD